MQTRRILLQNRLIQLQNRPIQLQNRRIQLQKPVMMIHSSSGQVSNVMSYGVMVGHVNYLHSYEPCTAPRTSYDLPVPIAPRRSLLAAPLKVQYYICGVCLYCSTVIYLNLCGEECSYNI